MNINNKFKKILEQTKTSDGIILLIALVLFSSILCVTTFYYWDDLAFVQILKFEKNYFGRNFGNFAYLVTASFIIGFFLSGTRDFYDDIQFEPDSHIYTAGDYAVDHRVIEEEDKIDPRESLEILHNIGLFPENLDTTDFYSFFDASMPNGADYYGFLIVFAEYEAGLKFVDGEFVEGKCLEFPGYFCGEMKAEEEAETYTWLIEEFVRISRGSLILENLKVHCDWDSMKGEISFINQGISINWKFDLVGKWLCDAVFNRMGQLIQDSNPDLIAVFNGVDLSFNVFCIERSNFDLLCKVIKETEILEASSTTENMPERWEY